MMQQPSRPIAPLPHHGQPGSQQHGGPRQSSLHYTPRIHELQPGAKGRLFLSVRSGIPSEVDWALPRLVLGSFDHPEHFRLQNWVDGVATFQLWPDRWIDELEKEVTLQEVRNGQAQPVRDVLSIIPEWARDTKIEERAINSLLIMRNASVIDENSRVISTSKFLDLMTRFFQLPPSFLLDLSLRCPEPFHHLFVIIQSMIQHCLQSIDLVFLRLLAKVLPDLLIGTRDGGMINQILPILIRIAGIQNASPENIPKNPPRLPESLIPHLLYLLTLNPPNKILEFTLDLLITLTLQPNMAKVVLADPSFPAHLRDIVLLLHHGAKSTHATWDSPTWYSAVKHPNPASMNAIIAKAAVLRDKERTAAEQAMVAQIAAPAPLVENAIGDKPPTLPEATKSNLYAMAEPARSIEWMRQTFTYNQKSQLLQVTFWHAYRDFFSSPSSKHPLLSASEVIKNVTIAFSGASAKVWIDPTSGQQKFVVAGLGFRKSNDDEDRYICHWENCKSPRGASNSSQLLQHVQFTHLSIPLVTGLDPTAPATPKMPCKWGTCGTTICTTPHLMTHIPDPNAPRMADTVYSDRRVPADYLSQKIITRRPPTPLPASTKLSFAAQITESDKYRNPIGTALLAALLIRNLAKMLRAEIALEEPAFKRSANEKKKKHLEEQRYGLPIPRGILKEIEEEEKENQGEYDDEGMSALERDRARNAFIWVEGKIISVIEENISGLPQYLAEAFGW